MKRILTSIDGIKRREARQGLKPAGGIIIPRQTGARIFELTGGRHVRV
jgi:hypothetical protein